MLVIKLGALGDFIQSMAAARVIREYHVGARITLLTTEVTKDIAEKAPYFDTVEADGKPTDPRTPKQRKDDWKFSRVEGLGRGARALGVVFQPQLALGAHAAAGAAGFGLFVISTVVTPVLGSRLERVIRSAQARKA